MQTVIGRVVNNAEIRETKDGRKLVAFQLLKMIVLKLKAQMK
ncbi:MAG TPA: hypothetical protein PKY86_05290 [Niabella sp.]|nr:hypothetical protein [Niabella sp.]HQX73471.1 hypothetical protein [Chitinophagaceae bacterium]HRB72807.1 hypothetical protein [Flavobacterium sp.]HQX21437.1 hypothetical protein [Niabella sp.]HRB36121.1 hypothetical protein [Niabella sp.]